MTDVVTNGDSTELLNMAAHVREDVPKLITMSFADGSVTQIVVPRLQPARVVFRRTPSPAVLRKWLADDGNQWVRPKEVREARDRAAKRTLEELPHLPVERMNEINKLLNAHQSEAAHHRRRFTESAVSAPLRTALRGPHDVWIRRAEGVNEMIPIVEEGIQCVAAALGGFFKDFFTNQAVPLLSALAEVRKAHPLPPDDR